MVYTFPSSRTNDVSLLVQDCSTLLAYTSDLFVQFLALHATRSLAYLPCLSATSVRSSPCVSLPTISSIKVLAFFSSGLHALSLEGVLALFSLRFYISLRVLVCLHADSRGLS